MKNKTVYFVGIKGVGMAALACYYYDLGWTVLGSDVKAKFLTDDLFVGKSIKIFEGFDPSHIKKSYDLVIVTGAHGGMTNIEAKQSQQLQIPTLMHGKALGNVMKGYKQISVAGTHGKTTTSAFISSLLSYLDVDPSYVVGTPKITDLKTSGHAGKGNYFVAEADEYATCPRSDNTPRFLWQNPDIAVITNIEFDHPDIYNSLTDIEDAFLKFSNRIKEYGTLVAGIDNPSVKKITAEYKGKKVTYGQKSDADFSYSNIETHDGTTFFRLLFKGKDYGEFSISLFGKHNVLNALATIATVFQLGYSFDEIRKYLPKFKGTKRRFETIKKTETNIFIDDYAHHPSEIQTTLQGARMGYRDYDIFVIFQPHTFSRTKALLSEFSKSFFDADEVFIAPIYASAREGVDSNFSSRDLVDKIKETNKTVYLVDSAQTASEIISKKFKKKTVILTMGAGDIYEWQTVLTKNII